LAPRTVSEHRRSHIEQTLTPGVPVPPALSTSLDVAGQWRVCRAGTSPTEERKRLALHCRTREVHQAVQRTEVYASLPPVQPEMWGEYSTIPRYAERP